ncbi:MAG TPA: homocysteine S-methyltransferase family protein [Gemmataceae bacterium]
MSRFLDALHSGRVLLMDGAMGTELLRAGLAENDCGEAWNVTNSERVRVVHQAYADAGAEVLLTNTFQANRPALWRRSEKPDDPKPYIEAAQKIIAALTSAKRFALGSIGPEVTPPSTTEFPFLYFLSEIVGAFPRHSPISGLILETYSTPRVRFVVKKTLNSGFPALLSMTYQRNAKGKIVTLSGHKPEWFAQRAKHWGVAALGVNCGRDIDMDDIIEIVRRYRAVTDLPLFARPNAGTPTKKGKRWIYPHTPEAMAARLPVLLEAGVSMVGGCCGTTPEHVAAFRPIIDAWNKKR